MKKITLTLIAIFFSLTLINAQQATAIIDNVMGCQESEILVPINLENFLDVGAITMFIGFDTLNLSFVSVENIHPALSGLLYNEMNFPVPQIGFSWTNLNGANIASGKMCDIRFEYSAGENDLVFNPGCEVVTTNLDPVDVQFINGGVSPEIIVIEHPDSSIVEEGGQAVFDVLTIGVMQYQWQLSENAGITYLDIENNGFYQGAHSAELIIQEVSPEMDGNLFRCRLSSENCIAYTNEALLTVNPAVLSQTYQFVEGWNGFSTYLLPENTDIEQVFQDLSPWITIITDGAGVYCPAMGINSIGNFDATKGYCLKLTQNVNFEWYGYRNSNPEIEIPAAWSYLPVLTSCDIAIEDLFADQAGKIVAIIELPGTKVYWPEMNVNSLNTLKAGKAYMIRASELIEVIYPVCP